VKKYTLEQVKNIFSTKGWYLLSKVYKDNKQKLNVICNNGHKLDINLNNFLTGWRCTECYGKRYLNYERVKEDFIKNGYILLSKKYIDSSKKLKYKCSKGHISTITYNQFSRGNRCGVCNPDKKKTKKEIIKIFVDNGYSVLSKTIKNTHSKLKVKCLKGHIYKTTYSNFLNGCRCMECFHQIKGKNHHNWTGGKTKCVDCGKNTSDYKSKRCKHCSLQLSLNPSWKGGLSFFPYSIVFNNKLKEFIRKRDNYTYQNCGKQTKRKLDVHHIDYDKQNCEINNLISLCRKCHSKSNYNRDFWYAYYKFFIKETQ